jgi:tryptophanyl-tRNA synthetase
VARVWHLQGAIAATVAAVVTNELRILTQPTSAPEAWHAHQRGQSTAEASRRRQAPAPTWSLVFTGAGGELDRNPTVKEEIEAAGLTSVNAAMYTYPVHQAADILFCKRNVVPVGRDQLAHLELTRKIARRFNQKYCTPTMPLFPEPEPLLSNAPKILGLDGSQKMSKSRQ